MNDEEQGLSGDEPSEETNASAVQEESPEDILALIDGIESALAADATQLASSSEGAAEPPMEDDLPAALRPARIPEELSVEALADANAARSSRGPETPAARSSVRPAGYAARADSYPPPRRIEPVPMPRRVHLDSAPRSAGPIPRVFGSTRDVLAKFRWGA